MSLPELLQLMKLLLKFSVVVAKNTQIADRSIELARAVSDTLSQSWGVEDKPDPDIHDIPF